MTDTGKIPHNYVSFDELLMNRHWEYPMDEQQAVNMARVWFRVNQLVSQYPAEIKEIGRAHV